MVPPNGGLSANEKKKKGPSDKRGVSLEKMIFFAQKEGEKNIF